MEKKMNETGVLILAPADDFFLLLIFKFYIRLKTRWNNNRCKNYKTVVRCLRFTNGIIVGSSSSRAKMTLRHQPIHEMFFFVSCSSSLKYYITSAWAVNDTVWTGNNLWNCSFHMIWYSCLFYSRDINPNAVCRQLHSLAENRIWFMPSFSSHCRMCRDRMDPTLPIHCSGLQSS